jgi:hypothetical protein
MAETSTSISASGQSGGTCAKSGPYFCGNHTDTLIFVSNGQKFPNCPISRNKKGHSTTWSAMGEAQAVPISTVDNLDSVAIG